MVIKACYKVAGQETPIICKIGDIPAVVATSKNPQQIAAAVSAAVGQPVSLLWAIDGTKGDILVEDTGTPVSAVAATGAIERPSQEVIAGLIKADGGLAQLRDIVNHFGVAKDIKYSEGLSAQSIADKLIALWYK